MDQKEAHVPDYLIIGAQKAGTTSLYTYLVRQHPNVARAKKKELYFFNDYYNRGLNWYRRQFPAIPKQEKGIITGEATPNYLDDACVPGRVYQVLPNVKLIVLLRNPVDRAYSQYQMGVRNGGFKKGNGTISFEELTADKKTANPLLERSIYIHHLKNWMKYFPRRQFLIIKSEDLFQNPRKVFFETTDFLGLPRCEPGELKNVNWAVLKRSRHETYYKAMKPATRKTLEAYFKPYNHLLYKYLGRDLEWETL